MKKRIFLIFITLLFVFVVVAFYTRSKMYGAKNDSDVEQKFVINSGEGVNQISERLEQQGLISNNVYFDIYVWMERREENIIAGSYTLKPNMTIPEITDYITQGKKAESKDKKITIIEGWSNDKIGEYFAKEGILSKEEFANEARNVEKYKQDFDFLSELEGNDTLEGYLFPDTYLIYHDADAEMIFSKILNNFDKKITSTMREDIKKNGRSLKEVIIMASIIEREVMVEEDQKIVAGIFWDRYEDGYPLQSCATINYIIGSNKKQLSYEDTRIESPYNTYINKGLTPGPISNPGISAIMAAIYPKESNYYYFLNDPETGEIFFSQTLDEHNRKKDEHGL